MIVLSPQLGLSQKSILGGEVFDREILLGLAKKGFQVEIILPNSKSYDKNIKNLHINYLKISHFPPQLFNILTVPTLLKLKDKNIEILRLHRPQFMFIPAILFKFISPKTKIVATYHKFDETNFGLFSEIVNSYWDHIICDSSTVKKQIEDKFQISSQKITVVHNGAPSYLKPTPKDKGLQKRLKLEGKIVLLFMGLFINRKNPLFLTSVLFELSKKNSNVVLIFLGHGPLKERIIEKAKQLNIENKIRFISPIFGAEKNKIHNIADIFVHPSLDEGFALAPLEAMACAKPIVMTDGYSASEAVEDKINGFLCRANDLDDWCQKLTELIKNAALRNKMGQASLKKVKKEFQWKLAVQKHIEVFKTLTR